MGGWIGVDLDGTLAHYDPGRGLLHIGEPIPAMVSVVKSLIAKGFVVKVFTARASISPPDLDEMIRIIQDWCELHIGHRLEVTNMKDFGTLALLDDRAYHVVFNKGIILPQKAFIEL